jgi:hypothetical protein
VIFQQQHEPGIATDMHNQETQGQNANNKMEEKETCMMAEEHRPTNLSAGDDDVTQNKTKQGSPSLT